MPAASSTDVKNRIAPVGGRCAAASPEGLPAVKDVHWT
jgi:hypothetical protein